VPGVPADHETDDGEEFEVRFFPVACRMINAAIEGLREYVRFMPRSTPLIDSLFQVHFQATSTEQCVISLLYRTEPRDGWLPLATDLQERLRSHIREAGFAGPVFVAARAPPRRYLSVERDWITERFQVGRQIYRLRQREGLFCQPNAGVAGNMLEWASEVLQSKSPLRDDLLELFCGSGTFTIPLADQFRQVWASEVDPRAGDLAEENAKLNGASNVHVMRVKSEKVLVQAAALATSKDRVPGEVALVRQLRQAGARFRTVLVDPPRAGLGSEVSARLGSFPQVLYISCNPVTLEKDLSALQKVSSHSVRSWAVFDQFPYTEHVEVGVLLEKRAEVPDGALERRRLPRLSESSRVGLQRRNKL